MTKTAPRCRYCGKPIAKQTRTVWLHDRPLTEYEKRHGGMFYRHLQVDKLPTTKAECQQLTNQKVVSVKYGYVSEFALRINRFGEWDGESYDDPFFCKGNHAKRFGEFAARSGKVATKAYHEAVMKDYEDV